MNGTRLHLRVVFFAQGSWKIAVAQGHSRQQQQSNGGQEGESGRQRVALQMAAAEIHLVVLNRTFPNLKRDAGYIFGESYFADNSRSEKILGDNLVQTLHFKAQKTDVQKGEATCSWLYNQTIDILGLEPKFPICSAGIFPPGDIGELSIQIKTLSQHDLQGSNFLVPCFSLKSRQLRAKWNILEASS